MNDTLLSALNLGLDLVQRSLIQTKMGSGLIGFVLIKFDIGISSWAKLLPVIAEYRNVLDKVKQQNFEMLNALEYLDDVYASLEKAFNNQDEQMAISFYLTNQPEDLAKFAIQMTDFEKQLVSLIRLYNS